MRRLPALLVFAAVSALFFVTVVGIGSATPEDFCDPDSGDYKPNHPRCADTTSTTSAEPPVLAACESVMTISGEGRTGFECWWTPERPEGDILPGIYMGTVAVSNAQGIKGPPLIFVRDDSPGDICLLEQQAKPPYEAKFYLTYDEGLFEGFDQTYLEQYEPWARENYWNFKWADAPNGTGVTSAHWCAPQDPVLDSVRWDTNGAPLHFRVGFKSRSGGQLTITLGVEYTAPG